MSKIVSLETYRQPKPTDAVQSEPEHILIARKIWKSTYPLSLQEQLFLRDVIRRSETTPRQRLWLQAIQEKAEGFEATMG